MIQLFVSGAKVDLFKDENIEIQDSIQDAKDIGKIFTTFSRTFTVPANKNNNNVFKNFYNFDIVNGFDPREKVRSVITKNGATYRKGFIQIRKVKLKNNKPTSYTIFFTGLLSTLKDKLQDDRLSDLLELDNYNHEYSQANVETGFEAYLSVNSDGTVQQQANIGDSDVCYPFISVQDRYALNDSGKVKRVSNNGTVPTGSGGRVNYQDLKPAIRLVRIIEAIGSQYDITFDVSFLADFSIFTELFMFLNRNKGRLGTEAVFNVKLFNTDLRHVSDFDEFNDNDNIFVYNNVVQGNAPGFDLQKFTYNYTITAQGEGSVRMQIIDANNNNEELQSNTNEFSSGDNIFNFGFTFQIPTSQNDSRTFIPFLKITTQEGGISNIDVEVQIIKEVRDGTGPILTEGNYDKLQLTAVDDVIITNQIPKLKVIDFLTSIFKMFNLTAEVVDDVIKVQPLDDFYNSGQIRDITRFVDVTNSTVNRVDTIKQFNFKHEEANSLLLVKGNEIEDREYGNLEREVEKSADTVLGGQTLDIETNFYKILYERLRSENGTLSNIMFGWYVDDNQELLSNEPIIFYADKKTNTNAAIEFKNGGTPSTYLAPLNATVDYTTNFSREVSEYDFSNVDGLYTRFYDNYVRRVFSKQSRKIELDAVLRDEFIIKYRLSDILVYKNRRYTINDIKINLNTNKAKLTLLNILSQSVDPEAPAPPDPAFLELDDDDFYTGPDPDSKQFTVTSNVDWQITGLPSWASSNISSGSNNGTFTISLTSNNTDSNRSKTISVSGGGITRTINIVQFDVATLSISPQSATVGPESGSGVITVTSDSRYSAFTYSFGFINNLNQQIDANGGGTITYFYDQNDGAQREQDIRIYAGGYLREDFTLIQSAELTNDNTAPSISLIGGDVTLIEGETYNEQGFNTSDTEDDAAGIPLTVDIDNPVDTNVPDNYQITYTVTDSGGLTDTAIRNVTVEAANTAPTIDLGQGDVTLIVGDTFVEDATASDAEDGDLTNDIIISGSVDTNTAGTYTLTYDVTDSEGLPADSETRTVTIEEQQTAFRAADPECEQVDFRGADPECEQE